MVGLFWKYKNSNDEYNYKYIRIGGFYINNIGSGLNFVSFTPVDDVDYRELENPFEIHIDEQQEYNLLIVGAEEEEEEQQQQQPEESFRTDTCVICLDKEPNILFTDCGHICTCSECEKIKPSVKCSYCRNKISKRIKILKKNFPHYPRKIFFIFYNYPMLRYLSVPPIYAFYHR